MDIVDIIRVPFGYMLEWLYNIAGNYGLALILFGIAIKVILLPISMKSKKSMMKMSRVAPMAKALEQQYKDDKAKYQAEVMKLYKEEGVSTTGGCLWSFIPLLILIPLYQVIREPMVYMLHLSAEHATTITNLIVEKMPELAANSYYQQMAAVSHIPDFLNEIHVAIPELANTVLPQISFDFLGLNLGSVPSWAFWTLTTASAWGLFVIPLISGLSNLGTMWVSQKLNNTVATNNKGEQVKDAAASSMKTMMYMMPLMSIWIGFQMPAGMSIYWITQAVVGVAQEYFLTKHYRKVYAAEDAVRKEKAAQQAAIEAEKAKKRAEQLALNPEGFQNPNTSKKKLAAKEKVERQGETKESYSATQWEEIQKQREEAANAAVEEDCLSGIEDRPFARGRGYKPSRHGRNTSEVE